MQRSVLHQKAVVCVASGTALSPRQRKLAAKRKQKQEQKSTTPAPPTTQLAQQELQQHANSNCKQPLLQQTSQSPSVLIPGKAKQAQQQRQLNLPAKQQVQAVCEQQELPESITSLQELIQQQQQQQQQQQRHATAAQQLNPQATRVLQTQLQSLNPSQLVQLIKLWAQQARSMTAEHLSAGAVVLGCYLTCYKQAAQQRLQQGQFDRQQLADVAWGLAHFDALEWRGLQQQQKQQQQEQQEQQHSCCCLPLRWCGVFQQALQVPFLVLPNLMPHLRIDDVMSEVTLARDVIYLSDDNGGLKAVPETRLTGWQSDIGATFCYSGKEMVPAEEGLTPTCAEVRDVLARVTGEHFDSLLINYYQDGKCGMRYHVDPLYGKWTPNAAVVSLGDTRQFVFRKIGDHSTRWSYTVSNGDVVVMFGDCQEVLQHAVKVEAAAADAGPRVSLVYKQRVKLPDGSWA